MTEVSGWKLKVGNFLFKHRTFTPVPLILLVLVLFRPLDMGTYNLWVSLGGLLLALGGQMIRVLAVGYSFPGTSGRETYLRADSLNTTGIYSLVRNPLYIGNFFIFCGVVTVFSNGFALLMFALFSVVQYHFIIRAEETFLNNRYGQEYHAYLQRVRRIFPAFSGYQANRNPFSLKKVIFKEKDSLFNLLIMILLLLVYKEKVFTGAVTHTLFYSTAAGVLTAIYILVKVLKKRHLAKEL